MQKDILIIGAGAAGLMAMKQLCTAGYKVAILEAGSSAGGRIKTTSNEKFTTYIEEGAEFIHSNLPLTIDLLKQAGISYEPVAGKMVQSSGGGWSTNSELDKHWKELMDKMNELNADMDIQTFLQKFFSSEKYAALCKAVQGFAEGFDLADISNASVLAVKEEWDHSDDTQYRINGGYKKLVDFLVQQCVDAGGEIFYNAAVKRIEHSDQTVTIHTEDKRVFQSAKVILTVSAGVLKSGSIAFTPAIDEQFAAIQQLGFGTVIKIFLQFSESFWQQQQEELSFAISGEAIPTWWTQWPKKNNMLTGWLGGPKAALWSEQSTAAIVRAALLSLSSIFKIPADELEKKLVDHKVIDWHNNPHVRGGYSYQTVFSADAKKLLLQPVNDVIFFAGEALSSSSSIGTVEAALQSGVDVSEKIILLDTNRHSNQQMSEKEKLFNSTD